MAEWHLQVAELDVNMQAEVHCAVEAENDDMDEWREWSDEAVDLLCDPDLAPGWESQISESGEFGQTVFRALYQWCTQSESTASGMGTVSLLELYAFSLVVT